MALTDSNACDPPREPACAAARIPIPYQALAQLPRLQDEAGRNVALSRFLAASPSASVILMLAGLAALLAAHFSGTGGGTLKADFAWAALVLIGVVAMTRNYIRGFARSLRRVPLEEAASDLRVLLLYTGTAWGAGAFLVMPDLPAPVLVVAFAVLPCAALALVLKHRRGAVAFIVPASLLTASAAILGAWPRDIAVAAAILAAGTGIALLARQAPATGRTRPAGLPAP